jgi:hypothetical protein
MKFIDFFKGQVKAFTRVSKTGKMSRVPDFMRQGEKKEKPVPSGLHVGKKVRIKSQAGSLGRGLIGTIKDLKEGMAHILSETGKMFSVRYDQLEMAKSKDYDFECQIDLIKSEITIEDLPERGTGKGKGKREGKPKTDKERLKRHKQLFGKEI